MCKVSRWCGKEFEEPCSLWGRMMGFACETCKGFGHLQVEGVWVNLKFGCRSVRLLVGVEG